jgi:hypothetical protein
VKNVTDTPVGSRTIQSIDGPISGEKLSTVQTPIEIEIIPDIEIPVAEQMNGNGHPTNSDKMGSLNLGHNEV